MPPKPRQQNTIPKSALTNNKHPAVASAHPEPQTAQLSPELEQQFEVELCWCIQQLQTGLKSGKLSQKQIQDHSKALNTLTSNTAPIIKKRQVMRLSFGDYRVKMQEQEKKQKSKALKIIVSPAKPDNKSVFVKKSNLVLSSENDFRFNFKATEEDMSESKQCVTTSDDTKCPKPNFNFTPSNNEFRFHFNNESLNECSGDS